MEQQGWRLVVKRAVDFGVAAVGLVAASPVLAAAALAVRATTGSPVFFFQPRPGRGGRIFRIAKFRTMTDARDARGEPLPDEARTTAVGRFLRASSIDELPQLWNVLRGELSLVGPRPLLTRYLPRYTPAQARRHEVLPGITGWAQVNGRNALGWDAKFALDVWYVEHWSLLLDARILALTALRVLTRSGTGPMPEFMGSAAPAPAPPPAA
jgi:lipopolysaccharide/colanic/teichoic acid biosynthesis glycosyltransferase